jgi:taurine dioxygenase
MSLPTIEPVGRDHRSSTAAEPGYEHIAVHRVSAHIGAVIDGVRASGELDDGTADEVRRALAAHRVVFLRGQDHVDDATQRAFAARLGEVTKPHPTVSGDGEAILPIDAEYGKANSWHTDVTFVDRIPSASVLRAVDLPPYGGATVWADTVTAYERLHVSLQSLVDRLWAVHSNQYDYVAERHERGIGGVDVKEQAYRDEFVQQEFETEHPVVRIHPVTGERSLLLGHFVRGFLGLSTHDFQDLFHLLQRHITDPDNTVTWGWSPGDIAIWDNAATQHRAIDDYADHQRLLHRVTLAGPVPVAADGRTSRVRRGDASGFSSLAAA